MTSEPEPLLRVGGNFGDFNIVAAVVALGVRMIGGNAPSPADVLEKSDQDDSPESEFSIPNAVD